MAFFIGSFMQHSMRLFFALSLLCINSFFVQAQEKESYFPLTVKTAEKEVTFQVRLALDRETRAQGLMYVKEMPDTEGMLFIYPNESKRSFWMRNTYISLDIIYIKRNGRIDSIQKNVPTLNDDSRPSEGKVMSVLEIKGGLSDKLGIKVGDTIKVPLSWRLKAQW
ncbi:DUF192 domain-containing protein [Temperatibacter marinus]|uniref:DUF192 domain-containing protein n=1 Tax=Temperatibacter marinus TaxID=1456591 RepID=A0AA52EF36_9PROT|nr:DUF192 domain-containing protein [Temperatibacter marinus]WND01923.1 DUF192 domain-containing protein [Temperatibacter marinus]